MASEAENNLRLEIGHVLFIDLVGYSKLLIEEQKKRLRQLTEIVLATSQVAESTNEQLVRLPTGDGMALVFRNSSEEPARCALEIAQALKAHPDIPVRMGIHSGPVSEVTDVSGRANIAGAGINMAQRVMDCGDAGHILLSRHVAEDLEQYRHWQPRLHELGECEVKHGVRISVFNLYTGEQGNPGLPEKFRKAKAARVAKRWKIALPLLLVTLLVLGGLYYRSQQRKPLTDKDTIVLADFTNATGDPVFDGTLRQGLAVQLEQSPFLSLVSDSQISQTLRLMGQPADARLTPEIARDLCQRIGSKALVAGSIANLGGDYVVGLRAVNCITGESMAEEQVQAAGKEKVLDALSRGATQLREKLGESLRTVQKFDTPLEQATTTSLEALQAFSLGDENLGIRGDNTAALASYQRAIQLDPQFASAYAGLATVYSNLDETTLAAENYKKAFELRQRASEAERFFIESSYYSWGLGNVIKALTVFQQWEQTYPRDDAAPNDLSIVLCQLGQYEQALAQARAAVRLFPADGIHRGNVFVACLYLNRWDEARAAAEEAQAKGADSYYLHWLLYRLAFLKNDETGMTEQARWAVGKPGVEDLLLFYQADTAAYFGSLEKARKFSRRAIALALHAEQKETAAGYSAEAALREALYGNVAETRQAVAQRLTFRRGATCSLE